MIIGLFIGDGDTNEIILDIDGGNFTTNEGYVKIKDYEKPEDQDIANMAIGLYKSKANMEAGKPIIYCEKIPVGFTVACTMTEWEGGAAPAVLYPKLKEAIESIDPSWLGKIFDDNTE